MNNGYQLLTRREKAFFWLGILSWPAMLIINLGILAAYFFDFISISWLWMIFVFSILARIISRISLSQLDGKISKPDVA